MKRLLMALASAGMFAVFMPATASADTLYLVTIDCGDGYPLNTTVDLATLTDLQASVQAIIDNPSGLTCSLSSSILTSPVPGLTAFDTTTLGSFLLDRAAERRPMAVASAASTTSNDAAIGPRIVFADSSSDPPARDYAIGAGTYPFPDPQNGPCVATFGIVAQLQDSGTAHGSQRLSLRGSDPSCAGRIEASVDCLGVDNPQAGPNGISTAEISGTINALSGAAFQGDTVLTSHATDNDTPEGRDAVHQEPVQSDCSVAAGGQPFFIDTGHITIRGPTTVTVTSA